MKKIILLLIIVVTLSCKKNYSCNCSTSTLKTTETGYYYNGVYVITSTKTETVVTNSVTTINHSSRDNAIEKCDSSNFTTSQYTTTCTLN